MKTSLRLFLLAAFAVILVGTASAHYNPQLGRWLSRDPMGEAGGFNLYAYCGNDPVNKHDPTGLATLVGGEYQAPRLFLGIQNSMSAGFRGHACDLQSFHFEGHGIGLDRSYPWMTIPHGKYVTTQEEWMLASITMPGLAGEMQYYAWQRQREWDMNSGNFLRMAPYWLIDGLQGAATLADMIPMAVYLVPELWMLRTQLVIARTGLLASRLEKAATFGLAAAGTGEKYALSVGSRRGAGSLNGQAFYVMEDSGRAMQAIRDWRAYYGANHGGTPLLGNMDRTGAIGGQIDTVSGNIKLNLSVPIEFRAGFRAEEFLHFKQLHERGWLGRELMDQEINALESEAFDILTGSGFKPVW